MRNLNNAKTGKHKQTNGSGPGYMGENFVGHRRRWGYGYKDAEVKVCVCVKNRKHAALKFDLGGSFVHAFESYVWNEGVLEVGSARAQRDLSLRRLRS
jgi:hypothetical protein